MGLKDKGGLEIPAFGALPRSRQTGAGLLGLVGVCRTPRLQRVPADQGILPQLSLPRLVGPLRAVASVGAVGDAPGDRHRGIPVHPQVDVAASIPVMFPRCKVHDVGRGALPDPEATERQFQRLGPALGIDVRRKLRRSLRAAVVLELLELKRVLQKRQPTKELKFVMTQPGDVWWR